MARQAKRPVSAHWTLLDDLPLRVVEGVGVPNHIARSPYRQWRVACVHCKTETTRNSHELNRDYGRCPCRADAKTKVLLEYQGSYKSIKEWRLKYPSDVKEMAVRNRLSKRNNGIHPEVNYTDAMVLFGQAGRPEVVLEELRPEYKPDFSAIARELMLVARKYIYEEMSPIIDKLILETLVPHMDRHLSIVQDQMRNSNVDLSEVAGADYLLESIGSTLRETNDFGASLDDVIGYLQMESYESMEEKQAKLSPFIPVVDDSSLNLTGVEIMLLMSKAPMRDYA